MLTRLARGLLAALANRRDLRVRVRLGGEEAVCREGVGLCCIRRALHASRRVAATQVVSRAKVSPDGSPFI